MCTCANNCEEERVHFLVVSQKVREALEYFGNVLHKAESDEAWEALRAAIDELP